jgi:cytochrome c5
MMRYLPLIVLAVGTVLAAPSAQATDKIALKSVSVDLPTGDRVFADGPGSDAVNNNCLACHSAGMVLNQPNLAKAQWEAEVNKMRTTYKAPVDSKDVEAIVQYLVGIKGAK